MKIKREYLWVGSAVATEDMIIGHLYADTPHLADHSCIMKLVKIRGNTMAFKHVSGMLPYTPTDGHIWFHIDNKIWHPVKEVLSFIPYRTNA